MFRTLFNIFRGKSHQGKNMKQIPSAIQSLKRTAWKPEVTLEDGNPDDSKFSGTPWMRKDESWPLCQHCGKPMPLFVQINLGTLPDAVASTFGSGLLQLFYCINDDPHCESECQAFYPFTPGKLVRIIQMEGDPRLIERPEIAQEFPPMQIIGWQAIEDYPGWEEGEEHGVRLSDDEWEELADLDWPRTGDKLVGWPHWIQGIEYPHCPECGERMRLIFQVDSDDHITYQFGDLGCGHITQCPTHKDTVAFGWACS